ncbi:hypothetical protein Aperf_G00000097842 [Anoplocephala perfoliata]
MDIHDMCTVHFADEEILSLCVYCGKTFPKIGLVLLHIAQLHETESNDMAIRDTLEYTISNSSNCRKRFLCDICGKSFTTSSYRKSHIEVVHGHKKPYRCDQCGRAYTQKHSLKKHIKNVHSASLDKAENSDPVEQPMALSRLAIGSRECRISPQRPVRSCEAALAVAILSRYVRSCPQATFGLCEGVFGKLRCLSVPSVCFYTFESGGYSEHTLARLCLKCSPERRYRATFISEAFPEICSNYEYQLHYREVTVTYMPGGSQPDISVHFLLSTCSSSCASS